MIAFIIFKPYEQNKHVSFVSPVKVWIKIARSVYHKGWKGVNFFGKKSLKCPEISFFHILNLIQLRHLWSFYECCTILEAFKQKKAFSFSKKNYFWTKKPTSSWLCKEGLTYSIMEEKWHWKTISWTRDRNIINTEMCSHYNNLSNQKQWQFCRIFLIQSNFLSNNQSFLFLVHKLNMKKISYGERGKTNLDNEQRVSSAGTNPILYLSCVLRGMHTLGQARKLLALVAYLYVCVGFF